MPKKEEFETVAELMAPGSSLIRSIKFDMTTTEEREWQVLDRKTSRMWRNFWIECAHRRGYSKVEIARQFDMSESTVRQVLSK